MTEDSTQVYDVRVIGSIMAALDDNGVVDVKKFYSNLASVGMVIVPTDPDLEMQDAGYLAWRFAVSDPNNLPKIVWSAMLSQLRDGYYVKETE